MYINSIRYTVSVMVVMILLLGTLPARAESLSSPLASGGEYLWAKSIGGTSDERDPSMVMDADGNIFIAGRFGGTVDFDPGAGTANLTSAGEDDIFVIKLDSSGDLVWARGMGGTLTDFALDIALDSSGNVYTTGAFSDTADFDPGVATFDLISAGLQDVFVSKLDSNGDFVWARSMSGSFRGRGQDIALDSGANVYTIGTFYETVDFDPGAGSEDLTSAGSSDIFISKLGSDGSFVWAKRVGGTGADFGFSFVLDPDDNIFATGSFEGTVDFDPDEDTSNLTSAGEDDIFVSRLDSDGNFVWAKRAGGTDFDGGHDINLDANGNAYITGSFRETADFDPGVGTYNLTSAGLSDIFVCKLDGSGNLIWARGMGGFNEDSAGSAIALDSNGNVYTTGRYHDTADFDPGAGTFNLIGPGSIFYLSTFVSKLDSNGNFVWAQSLGGADGDTVGGGIVRDSSGNLYITGFFRGTADFDPGPGTANLTSAGAGDIFISKLADPNQILSVLSSATDDGWILESTEVSNVGGTLNKTGTTLSLGDNASNKQYRSILSFDTIALPEEAVITSVTLKLKYAGKSGTLPFSTHGKLLADICEGAFKANSALQLSDFNAKCPLETYKGMALVYSNTKMNNWYSQSLNPDDFQYINLGGVTQFRLRFTKDDNNDFGADFLKIFSGNAAQSDRPQLIIEYQL